MKTKNIFKALALAMLMPAMVLTTACSNDDNLVNNTANTENTIKKGFELPVTINVTRQDDEATTRATFDDGTKKLSFSTGDQLFVSGNEATAGKFAGTLTWQSGGTFSGTLTTENEFTGTAQELLTQAYQAYLVDYDYFKNSVSAILLPADYNNYDFLTLNTNNGYDATISTDLSKTFALTKAAAVEQFSLESTSSYSNGFTLYPSYGILNFTITGLTPNTDVTVTFSDYTPAVNGNTMGGTVHTDGSGNATFAVAVYAYSSKNIQTCSLYVNGNPIALVSSSKPIDAGKIYNITRSAIPGALFGKFSVSSTDKVYFSKGNLQYTKSTGIWSFMDHQYSTVETTSQAIGDDYASQDVVSLFGWGTSGWNNGNTYYQPYNTTYTSSGYGPKNGSTYTYDLTGTYANADWGHNAISNGGNTADTWRTLTKDEWTYLFNTRSASTVNGTANARYAKAYLFGTTHGVIIFPDSYTHPAGVTAPTGINATGSTSWNGNQYTATDWAKMEAAGCVFLPAAGRRDGTTIYNVNEYVRYWTSTYYSAQTAYHVGIAESNMNPADYNQKNYGYSVRLVHDAN